MYSAGTLLAAIVWMLAAAAPTPPEGAVELVELRTEVSKTYLLPNGQHHAMIAAGPVHIQDEQGGWRDLETDDMRNCTTKNVQYWTGYVLRNNTGNFKTNQTIEIQEGKSGGNANKRQGWARFDISNIPDGATVTQVVFSFFNELVEFTPQSSITHLGSLDPLTAEAVTLFDGIYDGTVVDPIAGHSHMNWSYRYFNSTGVQLVQDWLQYDWFAAGLKCAYGDNNDNFARISGYGTGTYKPYLSVSYTPAPVDDMKAEAVLFPVGVLPPDTSFVPVGVYTNIGNRPIDSYDAWLLLTDPTGTRSYAQRITQLGLPDGESDTIEFPLATVDMLGNWVARCSVWAAGDYNPANNVVDQPFRVSTDGYEIDIAVLRVLQPERWTDTAQVLTPTAVWANLGDLPTNFTAFAFIGNDSAGRVWSDVKGIIGLPPGAETTIVFSDFNSGHATGAWALFCSTYAAGDTFPENDTLSHRFSILAGGRPPWRDGWAEVKPMPMVPSGRAARRGAWLALNEGDGLIYGTKGFKTQDFYRYDAYADTWTELIPPPLDPVKGRPLEKGCRGVCDGMNSIYMVHGNNTQAFWRFDIDPGEWVQLRDVPMPPSGKRVKGGGDLVYIEVPGEGRFIYLLKGDRCDFMRYNITTTEWEQLTDAPAGARAKWQRDSWLAYDGVRTIYAHKARVRVPEFWKYDILGDTWYSQQLAGMPLAGLHGGKMKNKKARDGGAGIWCDGVIYALKGGNTQQFFMYDVSGDSWSERDTVPTIGSTGKRRRVNAGAHLIRYADNVFFALKGNKTVEMWRYVVPGATAFAGGPARSGALAGPAAGRSFVTVGPNPLVGGRATVRYGLPAPGPARLAVYDAAGRCRHQQSFVAERRGTLSLNLRELSAGVYLLILEQPEQSLSAKLVVGR
ncbi:MAG: T9SS type A sorting domain-containing protein [bacterium]